MARSADGCNATTDAWDALTHAPGVESGRLDQFKGIPRTAHMKSRFMALVAPEKGKAPLGSTLTSFAACLAGQDIDFASFGDEVPHRLDALCGQVRDSVRAGALLA